MYDDTTLSFNAFTSRNSKIGLLSLYLIPLEVRP